MGLHSLRTVRQLLIPAFSLLSLAFNVASREKTHQQDKDQVQHVKGVLRDSIALLEQVGVAVSIIWSPYM